MLDGDALVVATERADADGPVTPRGHPRIERGDLLTVHSGTGAASAATDVFGRDEDRQTTDSRGVGF